MIQNLVTPYLASLPNPNTWCTRKWDWVFDIIGARIHPPQPPQIDLDGRNSAGSIPQNLGIEIDSESVQNRFFTVKNRLPKMARKSRLSIPRSLNRPSSRTDPLSLAGCLSGQKHRVLRQAWQELSVKVILWVEWEVAWIRIHWCAG